MFAGLNTIQQSKNLSSNKHPSWNMKFSRFYVGCDICSNWFHGSCVGITAKMSKKMTEWVWNTLSEERYFLTIVLFLATFAASVRQPRIMRRYTACVASLMMILSEYFTSTSTKYFESFFPQFRFYIGCESCSDWFHGRCVGILQAEAESIEEWVFEWFFFCKINSWFFHQIRLSSLWSQH